jgi:hypothetical protein
MIWKNSPGSDYPCKANLKGDNSMAKRKRHVRINPVANAPILRKGGEHTVSRSGERSREKQKVRKLMNKIKAGLSGLDAVWAM